MALYPRAVKRLIRPGANDPAIEVVGAILHVDAGNNESLYNYFNGPSGGIESHFHIRRDGTVEQYRNTGWEADANYKANSFIQDGRRKGFVSIETQGWGAGEWTSEQMTAIRNLLTWLAAVHKFPLKKTTSPTGPGVGYHTLYPGVWTPFAKSCPGPDRIRQFERSIVPWMERQTVGKKEGTRGKRPDEALRQLRRAKRIALQGNRQWRAKIIQQSIDWLKKLKAR